VVGHGPGAPGAMLHASPQAVLLHLVPHRGGDRELDQREIAAIS